MAKALHILVAVALFGLILGGSYILLPSKTPEVAECDSCTLRHNRLKKSAAD